VRLFASAAVEVEQAAGPLSLVLGGRWDGYQAGGGLGQPSWGSNPQYLLYSARAARVAITLSRSDAAAGGGAGEGEGDALSVALVRPEVGRDGVPARRALVSEPEQVAAVSAAASGALSYLVADLAAGVPLLLVPSTSAPGVAAPFQLMLLSQTPLQLLPLPAIKTVAVTGRWRGAAAGGCDLHASWARNPMYRLVLQRRERVRISVVRPAGGWRAGKQLSEMVGFYVLRSPRLGRSGAELHEDLRRAVVYESTFAPMAEATEPVEVFGGEAYLVIPCTFAPGVAAEFRLSVSADQDFELEPLELPSPAKPAAAAPHPATAGGQRRVTMAGRTN